MKKWIPLILLANFLTGAAKGQDSTIRFYDLVKDDSVVMYFNDAYNFTEAGCAINKRYTKIDSFGDFYQGFVDINAANIITAKGYYNEGMKNGGFEVFYPNGQLKSKGRYKDNKPTGDWFYFYPDGKPERQLLVNAADTFLMQFYDEKGVQTVVNGNGNFKGNGASNDRFFRIKITASGKISNGKQDGEWQSFLYGQPYCTEVFDKGIFIKGRQSSMLVKEKQYFQKSYIRAIFLPDYIQSLEEFRVFKCPSFKIDTSHTIVKNENKNTDPDFSKMRSYLKDAIDMALDADVRSGDFRDYITGENMLKISFKVNEKGVPADFKKITTWGDQYFYQVTRALELHAKLPPGSAPMYFILIVTKSVGNNISYQYNFSRN